MSKWQEMTFGSFAQFNPKISLKKGEPYPFIPMENISPGQKLVKPENNKIYSGGGAKFEEGDTLFARITPCLENGKIAQASSLSGKPGFGSTEFFIFRGKQNISDSDFVYYFSQTESFRENAVKSMVGASGRQRADANFVSNSVFIFPDLVTQQKIAEILAAYDDLIENNLKRIKLLEEMAQITYEEWFVRLRFPGHESTPINPETGLPQGWHEEELSDCCKLRAGDVFKPQYQGECFGEIPFIKVRDLNSFGNSVTITTADNWVSEADCSIFKGKPFPENTVIFAKIGEALKKNRVRILAQPTLIDNNMMGAIPKSDKSFAYIYFTLKRFDFGSIASGSALPFLSASTLGKKKILMPTHALMNEFNKIVEPIFRAISNIQKQSSKLCSARDILLPRLMTGVIDVESYDPAQLRKDAA